MNVRSIEEFKLDIKNRPEVAEQAGRDFESTIRLREDVESFFDLREQMTQDDVELAQRNISNRITRMDLNVNPNLAKDAAARSELGEGEIITRLNRQHYVELIYDVNQLELCTHVDDGAIHVAKTLGWSEDKMMDEFNRYDREQALTIITPQIKADSSFMKNMILDDEAFDNNMTREELPYYVQKALEHYDYKESDVMPTYHYEQDSSKPNTNFFEAKPTDLPLPDDDRYAAPEAYKVKSDFRNRMYNTAVDDFGFDEKFDDDDDFEY